MYNQLDMLIFLDVASKILILNRKVIEFRRNWNYEAMEHCRAFFLAAHLADAC